MGSKCDLSAVGFTLSVAALLAVLAFTCVAIASTLNHSIFGAPKAPGWMIAAGSASAGAAAALITARVLAGRFCTCLDDASPTSTSPCAAQCASFLNMLTGLIVVFTTESAACFVASAVASIPVVGAAAITVILIALIAEALMLIPVALNIIQLSACAGAAGS